MESSGVPNPVLVQLNNPHRFYSVGTAGLSWRLAIPVSKVHVVDYYEQGLQKILVDDPVTGDLFWRNCNSNSNVNPDSRQ